MLETIDMIQAFRATIDQLLAADTPLDARSLKEKLAALTRMRDEIHSHFARIQKLKYSVFIMDLSQTYALRDRRHFITCARSKKMAVTKPGSETQKRLQSSVARLASDFLREFLFAVPSVPSAAEVERQQLVRKEQRESSDWRPRGRPPPRNARRRPPRLPSPLRPPPSTCSWRAPFSCSPVRAPRAKRALRSSRSIGATHRNPICPLISPYWARNLQRRDRSPALLPLPFLLRGT